MLYESGLAYAILSPTPITPGHVLVVPRMHAAKMADLDEMTGKAMWDAAEDAYNALIGRFYSGREAMQGLHDFYEGLRDHPPNDLGIGERAAGCCEAMLHDPRLYIIPVGYHFGGSGKGVQLTVRDHAHAHLHPIRKDISLSQALANSPDFY